VRAAGGKLRGTSWWHRSTAVMGSVGLHVAIVLGLTVGVRFSQRSYNAAQQPIAIQATVVDEAQVRQEMARLDELDRQEVARQRAEERKAREAADNARQAREAEQRKLATERREREEATRREEAQLAELQRQRQAEEQRAAEERQRREQAERERVAEEARLAKVKQEEEARQRQEAERRRQQEAAAAKQRAELEADLKRALAAEEERRQAVESGLLDEYVRLIENRIEQNWIPPATAKAGLECVVNVTQIPSGDIVDVRVGRCNGDDAVVRSIEAAVRRASPLPKPPLPALFERNLVVIFRPDV
jgi:colicin import membrane protein